MNCTNKQQETCDVEKLGCKGCFYNEKSADEMFEELGYKKQTKNFYNYLEYTKEENEDTQLVISFNGQSKTFMCALYQFGETKSRGLATTIQELQAINKKVQELRLERINIMEIKTKYEIGQHIWVVYENRGEVSVYDTTIDSINYDKNGLSYYTKEYNDYPEEQVIAYEDTNKLVAMIKDTMNAIHEREEKENA